VLFLIERLKGTVATTSWAFVDIDECRLCLTLCSWVIFDTSFASEQLANQKTNIKIANVFKVNLLENICPPIGTLINILE
jgi:hypothetical protein